MCYNILLFASLTLNSNVLSVLGSNVFEERGGFFVFWKCRQIAVRDRHVMPLCEFGLSWDWISKLSGEREQDHAFTSNYLCKRNKKNNFLKLLYKICTTNAAFIVVLMEGLPVTKNFLAGHCPDMKPLKKLDEVFCSWEVFPWWKILFAKTDILC